MKKKKIDPKFLIEMEDRSCPICGKTIKKGSKLHRCSKKMLKESEKIMEKYQEENEERRTFGSKMLEFDKYFNNNTYYDAEDN